MKDPTFDPYRKWLGIPEDSRPPTHYQLLSIQPGERDPDVIRAAVTQRSAYVRNYQAGKHADDATRLLNEIAAADACLGNKEKRAAYDTELKRKEALKKPRPAPAPPAAPTIDPLLEQAAAMTTMSAPWQSPQFGPGRAKQVNYLPLAIGGVVVVIVVVLGMVLASMLGGDDNPVAENRPPDASADGPADSGSGAATDRPAPRAETDRDRDAEPEAVVATTGSGADVEDSVDREPATAAEPVLVSIEPPTTMGVVADKVVLWNQHNGFGKDRGTAVCNLVLLRDAQIVWRKDAIQVPWSEIRDTKIEVPIPSERFDRVQVEIVDIAPHRGGGLAEVQVFVDGRNVALRRPTRANAIYSAEFGHGNVTDGITTSSSYGIGYWLLPDGVPGRVEVDLAIPRRYDQTGITADRVTLWNTHNGHDGNNGTLAGDLLLLLNGEVIWRKDKLAVPWKADSDAQLAVDLPEMRFSAVRFEIIKANPPAGGLAEIEVWQDGANIALRRPVTAKQCFSTQFLPTAAVDGVTTSAVFGQGYWLLGDAVTGWIEVEFAEADPEVQAANRRVGEYLCFAAGDWQRGLLWLARGDDERFRELAQAEIKNPQDAGTSILLADSWFDLATGYASPARERLQARAAWHYAHAVPQLPEFSRKRPRERLDQLLSTLTERDFLYFMTESEVSGIQSGFTLRDRENVVDGREYPYSLWMLPTANASSRVLFSLERPYRRLVGTVGIVDRMYGQTETPQTFRVVGDGRPLWTSQPLQRSGASEPFDIDLTNVRTLELFVDCPGSNNWAGAVWLDPRLEE